MTADFGQSTISWLVFLPINRPLAVLTASYPVIFSSILIIFIAGMFVSRVLLQPPLSKRFPRLIWTVDLIFVPLSILVAASLARLALAGLGWMQPVVWVDAAASLAVYISVAWLIARGIELFFWEGVVERRTGYRVPGLLRGLGYGTLILLALIVIMWQAGYPPTGLVVSTGLAAAVFGLALQNTLSDFFSGIALSLESSYGIGDWIELDDGTLGEVIDIGWRSTRLMSFNSSQYVVPNRRLSAARIHNYSLPKSRYAQWYHIQLPAEIEPAMAKRLLTSAISRARYVMHDPPPKIRLADAGTVPYQYMIYVHFPSYLAQYPGQDAMFREIDAELRRYGLQPASSTREIKFERRLEQSIQPATVSDALRAVDVFSALNETEIERLAQAAQFRSFEQDDVVVRQDEEVDAIHIVWSGILKSHFVSADGTRIGIEELSIGDSFGQVSVVTGTMSPFSVTAMTDIILVSIDLKAVGDLMQARPELAERFAKIVKNRMHSMARAEALCETGRPHVFPRTRSEIKQRISRAFFGPGREV